ncbi:glycoside hydrolase family 71/99-like protein [Pseudofulvibacter geojedonensis]|uniref:Glycoside hydrolase family 71/99-like protein n=1 Tax=Pseudofulvibacter geojedonensis TaxID=1123758 RepID=A0ABW3HZH0_9FLAO
MESEENVYEEDVVSNWVKELNLEELDELSKRKEPITEKEIEQFEQQFLKESFGAKSASKTNSTKVYAHYMPWFLSEEISGEWGQHWTMTNKNPNVINEEGEREIASHYYPKIGPYDTTDKDLQQYHLSLMKLCGIDGVIFDWYGSRSVLDFDSIKVNVESFIGELEKTDIEFAITYEDRVIGEESSRLLTQEQIETAQNDLLYIEQYYFSNDNYIQLNGIDLLMIFGPNYVDSPSDWDIVFSVLAEEPRVLSLWGAQSVVGSTSTGEFAWVDEGHISVLNNYYQGADFTNLDIGGAVYPGFNDFYIEGGWKNSTDYDWVLPHNGVQTFMESMNITTQYPVDFVQLITWNDFGEGTMIEPTKEYGYSYLEEVQNFTGVDYSNNDLRIPYYIYKLKKQLSGNSFAQHLLKKAHKNLMLSRVNKAKLYVCIVYYLYG